MGLMDDPEVQKELKKHKILIAVIWLTLAVTLTHFILFIAFLIGNGIVN